MKALILAAGYATRLRPLTDSFPTMLLPLAERPMLDYLLDRIHEVDELNEIHLVTNGRFAQAFRDWAVKSCVVQARVGTAAGAEGQGANAIYEHLGFARAGLCFVLDLGGKNHAYQTFDHHLAAH